MRLATRVAWIAAWTIALISSPSNALAQDGCLADLNDDGVVNGTDLAIVIGGWGPCPVNTTFVGGVVKAGGVPVPGAMVTTDLGGKTVAGEGGIFLLEIELPSAIETVVLSATAEIDGVGFEGTKTVSPVNVGGSNLVGLIEVSSGGCDTGLGWLTSELTNPGFPKNATVNAIISFDHGQGPALYVAGFFSTAGNVAASNIARWNGSTWSPVGAGVAGGSINCMAVFDDGTGPALFVGGNFTSAGGLPVNKVAKWDGAVWSGVGSGPGDNSSGSVNDLVVFDDGSGLRLYAGGGFFTNGGNYGRGLAKWDGSTWTAGFGPATRLLEVAAFAVLHMATGPELYLIGGQAYFPTSSEYKGLFRWDGSDWVSAWVPSCSGACSPTTYPSSITSGEIDGVQMLIVGGGTITDPFGGVAGFDGIQAYPFVNGVNGSVQSVGVWDDGTGPALYVSGSFSVASTINANGIARWDGHTWSSMGSGLDGNSGYASVIAGIGDSLYVGGYFTSAGGIVSNRIAQWGCTAP